MALMTLQDLEHHYNKANFSNTSPVSLEDMSIYGNVAPMAVNVPSGLETINIAQVPEAQSVTQSNGLDYLLNQEGGQNQNLTVEEYNKAIANQNTEPTNNFLTRALSGVGDKFSNVMDNRYVQGARNLGSMITDPLMGGLSYLAQKADKFSSLPYVNQQFIKENMSYRNPDSGLPQDLFSINTRSLRGNYPEYVEKRSKELNESLEESKKDWEEKFGSLNAIDPRYNKTWAEMNKMNLSGQKYYGDKYLDFSKKKQAFDKSIELKEIEKKKNKIIAQEKEAAYQAMFGDGLNRTGRAMGGMMRPNYNMGGMMNAGMMNNNMMNPRMGYAMGSQDRPNFNYGSGRQTPQGDPIAPNVPPGMQMDLRPGGFIELGTEPRADDVPAMVGKDEFVLNDRAVAGIGKALTGRADPRAGARALYDLQSQMEATV